MWNVALLHAHHHFLTQPSQRLRPPFPRITSACWSTRDKTKPGSSRTSSWVFLLWVILFVYWNYWSKKRLLKANNRSPKTDSVLKTLEINPAALVMMQQSKHKENTDTRPGFSGAASLHSWWITCLHPLSDLKPRGVVVNLIPGLPAYILFMCVRHVDFVSDEDKLKSLMNAVIAAIKKVVMVRIRLISAVLSSAVLCCTYMQSPYCTSFAPALSTCDFLVLAYSNCCKTKTVS